MREVHRRAVAEVVVRVDAALQQLTVRRRRRCVRRNRLGRRRAAAQQLLLLLALDHPVHVADDLLQRALQALLADLRSGRRCGSHRLRQSKRAEC